MTEPRQDDTRLIQALDAMVGSVALLVAHDLKLFPALGRGPKTVAEVAAALGIAERPAEALLCVAAAQGFVESSHNSSTALLICRNKATCSSVLEDRRIPCVPHVVFYRPDREAFGFLHEASWSRMIEYLNLHSRGIVCKPNDLSRGVSVRRVFSVTQLEKAVYEVFHYSRELCLSPFVSIDAEYRVIVFNGRCRLIYVKSLPTVIGDGVSMLGELIVAALGKAWTGKRLAEVIDDVEHVCRISDIPDRNEVIRIGWRHNLAHGARAELLDPASRELRPVVDMATRAAGAIGVAFAAVDVAEIAGEHSVLEVNTGVGTERLLRQVPSASPLVQELYGAVVEHLFTITEQGGDARVG